MARFGKFFNLKFFNQKVLNFQSQRPEKTDNMKFDYNKTWQYV